MKLTTDKEKMEKTDKRGVFLSLDMLESMIILACDAVIINVCQCVSELGSFCNGNNKAGLAQIGPHKCFSQNGDLVKDSPRGYFVSGTDLR